jgi:hypothetical protein
MLRRPDNWAREDHGSAPALFFRQIVAARLAPAVTRLLQRVIRDLVYRKYGHVRCALKSEVFKAFVTGRPGYCGLMALPET